MLEGACCSPLPRRGGWSPALPERPFSTVYVTSRVSDVEPRFARRVAGDDDDSRNEIMDAAVEPAPCGVDEVRCLLSEGRATLNGRSASRRPRLCPRRGSVWRQPWDLELPTFRVPEAARKNFLARRCRAFAVRRNPDADLIAELERRNWLSSVQRYARDENAPECIPLRRPST